MVQFNAAKMTVHETRRFENMMSEVERNRANTDYIAMMNDIELPDNLEVTKNDGQN